MQVLSTDVEWPCWKFVVAGRRASAYRGTTWAQRTPVTKACERDWPMPCPSPPPGTSWDPLQVSTDDAKHVQTLHMNTLPSTPRHLVARQPFSNMKLKTFIEQSNVSFYLWEPGSVHITPLQDIWANAFSYYQSKNSHIVLNLFFFFGNLRHCFFPAWPLAVGLWKLFCEHLRKGAKWHRGATEETFEKSSSLWAVQSSSTHLAKAAQKSCEPIHLLSR